MRPASFARVGDVAGQETKMEGKMNGAEAIADILKREGTEFLTCHPRQPLIETSAKVGIRPVLCHQERMSIAKECHDISQYP